MKGKVLRQSSAFFAVDSLPVPLASSSSLLSPDPYDTRLHNAGAAAGFAEAPSPSAVAAFFFTGSLAAGPPLFPSFTRFFTLTFGLHNAVIWTSENGSHRAH